MKSSILLIIVSFSFVNCQNNIYAQGERLYNTYCSNCHGLDGNGLKNLYPPINNSDYLEKNKSSTACIILNGLDGEIEVNKKKFMMPMEGFKNLTDVDITNIINYINTAWDNKLPETTLQEVKKNLESCN